MTTRIRVARGTDGARAASIYAPFVRDASVSFEELEPDGAAMGARIESTLVTHPWLVSELDGKVTGYAYAGAHRSRAAYRWSVEVAIYTAPEQRGRGLGTALYLSLFRVLRAQNYMNAYAGITLPNDASVALHESCGFAHLGTFSHIGYKHGRWHDVGWWQLRLRDDDAPCEPIPFSQLREERDVTELLTESDATP